MVSDNLRIDELILEVFEEHEDVFFWPVISQKDAKSFVKCLHDKGAPYEDLGKEIGEFEHNFSAWRKGLGRVGIGARMLERINRPVEEVIQSDEEDDTDHNLKLLSKLNSQKKQTKPTERESPKPNGAKTPVADPKQQKEDIAKSMMKNIDRVSEQQQQQTANKSDRVEVTKGSVQKPASSPANKKQEESKEEEHRPTEAAVRAVPLERSKKSPSPGTTKEERVAGKDKEEVKAEAKKVEVTKTTTTKTEVPKIEVEPQQNGEERQDPEVDEVKRKMAALKEKVAMLKKAKEEAAIQQSASSKTEKTQDEGSDKYAAMKKKISELRAMREDGDKGQEEPTIVETQDDDDDHATTTLNVPTTNPPPLVQAEEDDQDDSSSEESSTTSSSSSASDEDLDLETPTYYSDLDPENYDSDLEFDTNEHAKRLYAEVDALRAKGSRQDGPGHVFIFTDTPSSGGERGDQHYRILVGASRNPEKKFAEARRYNLGLKRVSVTAVEKRHAAQKAAYKALRSYKIEGERDWFLGPVDAILQRVSAVTEKFGSGPALVSFSSKC